RGFKPVEGPLGFRLSTSHRGLKIGESIGSFLPPDAVPPSPLRSPYRCLFRCGSSARLLPDHSFQTVPMTAKSIKQTQTDDAS
ncbi:MAG: hypothetical protein ACK56G_18975, partial [Pirellulaceae bacterium]